MTYYLFRAVIYGNTPLFALADKEHYLGEYDDMTELFPPFATDHKFIGNVFIDGSAADMVPAVLKS